MATTERREPAAEPPAPGVLTSEAPDASRKRIILALCCVAQFMVILDLSIVNVALPSIQVGLNFSSADLQWVVNAYAIVFGGFLMLAGRAADVYGHRRTFVAALLVFSLASLLGGLAPTSTVLIVARGIQGLGGAMMAACSLAIITADFAAGPERHRAIALWGAMNGLGGAVGVLLSGVITQYASWRWVLLINVPIGIVTAARRAGLSSSTAGRRRGRVVRRPRRAAADDRPGADRLRLRPGGNRRLGLGGRAGSRSNRRRHAGTFPARREPHADPLVPLQALTRQLKLVNRIILLFSASIFPMWYIGSLYLQQVLSLSADRRPGLAFLPIAAVIVLCASQAGKLVSRSGVRAGARRRPVADDRRDVLLLTDPAQRQSRSSTSCSRAC